MKFRMILDRQLLQDILSILFGCLIVAAGFSYFINPYHLVPGGVFGASLVVHSFVPFIQVGTIALAIQIPLLVLSVLCLGSSLGIRTLVATFAAPIMINFLCTLGYDTPEALMALDPRHLFGGGMDMTDDMLLTCLIGGSVVGIGETFIIRAGASSGGTDIIAMILHKYFKTKFSAALLMVDGAILLSGFLVFSLGWAGEASGSWTLTFYALITMVVMNRSLAWGLSGNRDSKLIHIVVEKDKEEVIRELILTKLDRTATQISSKGLYSQEEKQVLLMVVREKEVNAITHVIREVAPDSFVVVTDAYDVFGYRWNELPENNGMDFK